VKWNSVKCKLIGFEAMYTELYVSKGEIHLIEVEYNIVLYLINGYTQSGHQSEASKKQHKILYKRLKAKLLHHLMQIPTQVTITIGRDCSPP